MADRSRFSAEVLLMDDRLALIHIPIDLYPFFVSPILRLLFHDGESEISSKSSAGFVNISITPVECSIICSRELADLYFIPMVEGFERAAISTHGKIQISSEDYLVMQVEGQGLDAGQRVVELTSPLAMAGISIFFISTYFSDYIIVPKHSKQQVTETFVERGFNVEEGPVDPDSRRGSSPNIHIPNSRPDTPPPCSVSELQLRAFKTLKQHNVRPQADRSLRLVQCAAHYREYTGTKSYSILRPNLISALLNDNPRFFSLTIAATDPAPSLLLEERLLPRFSLPSDPDREPSSPVEEDTNLLLGSKDETLIAITLDLRELPLEAAGIVSGVASALVAGALVAGTRREGSGSNKDLETSFLSTSRAGNVIVREEELELAMECLEAEF
ncbi:hypothetical protein MGYG_04189 [Nannizzia gypsea CBS 118893]|uniref:CASTOR ACT domain-containing protein n=1 Tax=Arthroderma gypseum (strain ATCC MYA-4604 / CBS 118893) TaxID=535722 RepID=E4URR5_ARTGP|nr:hypothetical protein MGYG_04189 [Nannizzia gypsea CBS 118893]EFR01187.1 hypothetical protein MGYG_04189 [Nannizzia gypsea CBS 118893]